MKFPPKIPPPKNNFDCKVFMLEFAKYICVGRGFNFSYKEMPLFRDQIKEELLMKQINSRINSNFESQCMLVSHPLIIHLFLNPPRKNLWFSNAVVSVLLNIPILRSKLLTSQHSDFDASCELFRELHKLTMLPKFTKTSTNKFRQITPKKCIASGQKQESLRTTGNLM